MRWDNILAWTKKRLREAFHTNDQRAQEKRVCRREVELDELVRAGGDLIETCLLGSANQGEGEGADPCWLEAQGAPPGVPASETIQYSTLKGWI